MKPRFRTLWPTGSETEAWRRIAVSGLHPYSGQPDPTPELRDWIEIANCFRPVWILLECRNTDAIGVIKNPIVYEQQAIRPKFDPARVTILWDSE